MAKKAKAEAVEVAPQETIVQEVQVKKEVKPAKPSWEINYCTRSTSKKRSKTS